MINHILPEIIALVPSEQKRTVALKDTTELV